MSLGFSAVIWYCRAIKTFVISACSMADVICTRLLLILGEHPNKTLQSDFDKAKDIDFCLFHPVESLEEARRDARMLLENSEQLDSCRVILDESPTICKIQHDYVDALFSSRNINYSDNGALAVYIWINPETGYFYVGSGVRDVRMGSHLRYLKNGKHHNYKFQKAFRTNPNFDFYWAPAETRKQAYAMEQSLLDFFWGHSKLLNLSRYVETSAGFLGRSHSAEVKEAQSIRSKKSWTDERKLRQSETNKHYFSSLSLADREKRSELLSAAMTKRYKDSAERQKTSEAIRRSWTPERRAKASLISSEVSKRPDIQERRSGHLKQLWQDPHYREKTLEMIRQHSRSDEGRQRRRESQLLISQQPGYREKLSSSISRSFEDPIRREKNAERMRAFNAARSSRVKIDGVVYPSIKAAARALKIGPNTIRARLKDDDDAWCVAA